MLIHSSAGTAVVNAGPYASRSSGAANSAQPAAAAADAASRTRWNVTNTRSADARSRPCSCENTGSAPANTACGASRATVPNREAAANSPTSDGVDK